MISASIRLQNSKLDLLHNESGNLMWSKENSNFRVLRSPGFYATKVCVIGQKATRESYALGILKNEAPEKNRGLWSLTLYFMINFMIMLRLFQAFSELLTLTLIFCFLNIPISCTIGTRHMET